MVQINMLFRNLTQRCKISHICHFPVLDKIRGSGSAISVYIKPWISAPLSAFIAVKTQQVFVVDKDERDKIDAYKNGVIDIVHEPAHR